MDTNQQQSPAVDFMTQTRFDHLVGQDLVIYLAIREDDPDHKIAVASKRAIDHFGEVVGRSIHDLLPPEYRLKHKEQVHLAIVSSSTIAMPMRSIGVAQAQVSFFTKQEIQGVNYAVALVLPVGD